MAVFKCLGLNGNSLTILGFCSGLSSVSSDTGHPNIPAHSWLERYQWRVRTREGMRRASWLVKAFESLTMVISCILTKGQHHISVFERKLGYNLLIGDQSSSLKLVIINKLDILWAGCHFVFTKLKEDCSILVFFFASALSVHSPTFSLKIKFCY